MTRVFKKFNSEAARILKNGGIGVIPTDTIYGIVCSALSEKSVNEVYRLRKRSPDKPVIVLIGSPRDLKKFGIALSAISRKLLAELWPGPVSIILQMVNNKKQIAKFKYLHRGKRAIAFRVPKKATLRGFLNKTGPLIAPSANFEGNPPATNIKEAEKYFGDKADFYIDTGKSKSKPSTVISIINGKVKIIRAGATKITGAKTFSHS